MSITLAVVGLAILILSVVALAYAFWPSGGLTEQAPLAPTLFVSP